MFALWEREKPIQIFCCPVSACMIKKKLVTDLKLPIYKIRATHSKVDRDSYSSLRRLKDLLDMHTRLDNMKE